jgi:hypothetical protein
VTTQKSGIEWVVKTIAFEEYVLLVQNKMKLDVFDHKSSRDVSNG